MYKFETIILPGQSSCKAALLHEGDSYWLFADSNVQLSPWLALRRESNTDDDLEAFLKAGLASENGGYTFQLFDYFGIRDTSFFWFTDNRSSNLEDSIFGGRVMAIRIVSFDKFLPWYRSSESISMMTHLRNPNSHVWFVATKEGPFLPDPVNQARAELVTTLGTIALNRWDTYDRLNGIFVEHGFWGRRLIEMGSVIYDVREGVVGLAQGVSAFAVELYQAILAIPDVVMGLFNKLSEIEFDYEKIKQKITDSFNEIKEAFAKIPGIIADSAEAIMDYVSKGWEVLKLVFTDLAAFQAICEFGDIMIESLPHVATPDEGVSSSGLVITLKVVIAIGMAVASAMAAAALAALGIGVMAGRILAAIVKLYDKLKKSGQVVGDSLDRIGDSTSRSRSPSRTRNERAGNDGNNDNDNNQTSQPRASCTQTNGCPISMVSGEELLQHHDFLLAGPIPLVWERTYRSQRTHLSPRQQGSGLGHGWATPATQRLTVRDHQGKQQMVYHDSEGREIYFAMPQPNRPSVHTAEQLVLDIHGQTMYRLAPRSGLGFTRFFERQPAGVNGHSIWKLVCVADAFGNEQTWQYDSLNRLARIVTSCGQSLRFEYEQQADSQYLLKAIDYLDLQAEQSGEQAAQRLVSYTHDLQTDDLLAVTDPNGLAERYTYKHHLFQTRILKTGHTLYFQWCPHSQYAEAAHKARCERQWSEPVEGKPTYDYSFEFIPEQRKSIAIDTRGGHLTYRFNAQGLPLTLTNPEGQTTRYEYNADGLLTRKVNPAGHSEYYEYNAKGHLQSYTNVLGHTWQFKTNEFGLVEQATNPLGEVQKRRYNSKGQLTEQNGTRYEYNNNGQIQAIIDPAGRTTRYIWNHRDQLQAVVHPNGQRTRYQYNKAANPQPVKITGPDAHGNEQTTHYTYNAAGQCTRIAHPDGKLTHYQYNANGLVEQVQTELEKVQYTYRGLSQVHTKTTWSRSLSAASARYTDWQQVSQLHYEYDGERNLIGLTNEKGERYQLSYDGDERLIEEIGFDGRIQRYEYNAAGHLKTAYEFGYANAQIDQSQPIELARTQYKRNAIGQLLELQAQCQIPGQASQAFSQFEYDALSRLTRACNEHRDLAWHYNAKGQIERELQDQFEHRHEYNLLGQRIKTHYGPQGGKQHTIDYQFDTSEQGTGLFTGMAHNNQQLIHIERNAWGQETRRQHSNQLITHNEFDPQGRLLSQRTFRQPVNQIIDSAKPLINPIIERSYEYDAIGRIEQINDLNRGSTRYHYDALSRLKAVHGPVPEQFIFDPASNLLGMQSHHAEPADKAQGSLTEAQVQGNRLAFQADQHFQYDQLGRRVKKTWGKQGAFKQHYQYDAQHRLVQVTTQKRSQPQYKYTAQYTYDALGRRIGKTVTKVQSNSPTQNHRTQYYWLGDSLFGEVAWDQNQPQTTVYLFEPDQGGGNAFKPVAKVCNNELYHYHLDHLGTPQEITNAQGQVVWAPQYKAYGSLALKPAASPQLQADAAQADPLRFQGQYFDEETGLHYNRHRYYDPNCGQFITQDPIGLLGGLNCYQYVPNPVGWVDPLGLSAKNETAPDVCPRFVVEPGMEIDPKDVDVYRGGNDFTLKPNEYKIDKTTNLVKPTHGVSLDLNAGSMERFGGAYRIDSIPDELKIVQRGSRLDHFEIVPRESMTVSDFQELLNQITTSRVGGI